jgi:hypothetical protein
MLGLGGEIGKTHVSRNASYFVISSSTKYGHKIDKMNYQ